MFKRGIRQAIVLVLALAVVVGVGVVAYADTTATGTVTPQWCQWGGNCPTGTSPT